MDLDFKPVVLVDERTCETCDNAVSGKARFCADCRTTRSKAASRRSYLRNRETHIARSIARNKQYGITVEQVETLLKVKACSICGSDDRKLVFDHNHETGAVRGRICDHCSRGLGLLGDDAAVLRRAAEYLEGVR